MSRLYDQILEHGIHKATPPVLKLFTEPTTIVVDVSNVADYIGATFHAEDRGKSWIPSDFPNIAPPWKTAFFEWRPDFPEFRREVRRFGVYLIGLDYDEETLPDLFRDGLERLASEPRWQISCLAVIQVRGMIPYYLGSFGLLVDRYGAVCTFKDNAHGDAPIFTEREDDLVAKGRDGMDSSDLVQVVGPAFLGISFMHCKNVSMVLNAPPEKVQKKRIRRGKKPLNSYYTLTIDSISETLDKEGGAKSTGIKQALHICRGHFATYSPDKPLFGKYSGTFWKPQHVRGSKKHGEVIKDYAIKAPEGNS